MSHYTDLTPYHNAGIPAFVRELDGQEWVFCQVLLESDGRANITLVGFGEPQDIEDFPELYEYDLWVSYWLQDIEEAINSVNKELWEGTVLLDFVEVDE